jgi:hypothetical protein
VLACTPYPPHGHPHVHQLDTQADWDEVLQRSLCEPGRALQQQQERGVLVGSEQGLTALMQEMFMPSKVSVCVSEYVCVGRLGRTLACRHVPQRLPVPRQHCHVVATGADARLLQTDGMHPLFVQSTTLCCDATCTRACVRAWPRAECGSAGAAVRRV